MKKALSLALFVILASCGSSSENEEGKAEVYSSYDCLCAEPTTSTPDEFYQIPNEVLEIFNPTLKESSELIKDTIDMKTTSTDYRLVLRGSYAKLEVNTCADMQARELRRKRSWYVFNAGVYQENGVDKFEVREDGIYLIANEKNIIPLTNFCMTQSVSNEIISEKDYTKRFRTIANGSASMDVFMVSKADTTYKCSRISGKQIQLDMVSPKEYDCTVLKKE